MPDFICRLGTPSGEIVTKMVEAAGAVEARMRLESEGFRVFAVAAPDEGLTSMLSIGGASKGKIKQADFLLFSWADFGLQRIQVRSMAIDLVARTIAAASSNTIFDKGVFVRAIDG